jgi:hypothetical protein
MKIHVQVLPLEIRKIAGVRSLPARTGTRVVERSVEDYSLDEPIEVPQGAPAAHTFTDATELSDAADAGTRYLQPADLEGICANPLRDEPGPAVIGTVRRFGIVGLVAYALGAGLTRWCKSLVR